MYGMHHTSVGQDFMTFGNEAIGVHHAIQRRLVDAERHVIITNIRNRTQPTGIRNRLGGMMIALGTHLAGKTIDLQERQATMPAPEPKSGFVPTR